jgi:ubiquinone/menaquinone biosynthesis C-methylase UbiE
MRGDIGRLLRFWIFTPVRLVLTTMTEDVHNLRRRYERIAPLYDLLDLPFEYGRYRWIRPLLFQGLSGRILDAGVGTGRNMASYPRDSDVVGVDLSPAMLKRAERRRLLSPASVQLMEMDVTHLTFPDASFDAAVATFLFCTLPDELQVPALRELGRVLKPNGTIRLLVYTRPRGRIQQFIAKLWEPWIGWAYGASFDRRTEQHITEAGLTLTAARFVVDDLIRMIEAKPRV